MGKNLEISILMDFYGEILTSRQREFVNSYYNDDLSLSEISCNTGITKQGVQDSIKKSVAVLYDMEDKLKLNLKTIEFNKKLDLIKNLSSDIIKYCSNPVLNGDIANNANKILEICNDLIS